MSIPSVGPRTYWQHGGDALKFLVQWRPDRPFGAGEPDLAAEALDGVPRSSTTAARPACRA